MLTILSMEIALIYKDLCKERLHMKVALPVLSYP